MADKSVEAILASLTLDEKLSLLAGGSQWRTAAIDRVSVPNLKVSDGPSGARGQIFGKNVPAAFLPSGVSLGATWDVDLMREIGELLAEECESKSASVSLAPTMCIHRHPLGGRNFESFSEDPYLTGKLAVAHVQGMQSRGVGATPKHFVANDQETKRFKVNAHISPRALREVYLLPFQMVVRDADPWCMMTAYNKVNGHYCDASHEILTEIARNEWKWDGVFMSDWGGTTSTVDSINNGLDLEMPGPPAWRSKEALEGPLKAGSIDLHRVDQSAGRILSLLKRAGRFRSAPDEPEYCRDDPATRALLLKAACSGIVMLKNNNNTLPLDPRKNSLSKLAVVGPNAKRVVAGGGGSSYIKAPYWTSVHDSLEHEFGQCGMDVVFHVGAKVNRYLPTPTAAVIKSPDTGASGAAIDWHLTHDLSTKVVATTHADDLYFMSFGDVPKEIGRPTNFSFAARAVLTPLTSGTHELSLASIGPAELFLDDEVILHQSGAFEEKSTLFFTYGSGEAKISLPMIAGREYNIRIECHAHDRQLDPRLVSQLEPMEDKFQGFRLGYEEADETDLPAEAAQLAKTCDAAVVVVGRDKEWETEGHDIPIFELPGDQVRLIRETAAHCKKTIVVVQAGTPVRMDPWIDEVQAVLYTWYQGQELGNAVAKVLCGDFNPSGRLPVTFPRDIRDCPAFSSFPGEQHETYYSEGLFVGYRWWDLVGTKPHFPIGYGLSYCQFTAEAGIISSDVVRKHVPLTAEVTVRNTGGCAIPGRQTVILWSRQVSLRRLSRPHKQICAFGKTAPLKPGQSQVLKLEIDPYALGMFDAARKKWVIDSGSEFEILLGTNAEDAHPAWRITVPEEIDWVHVI